jgi:hypothetical protein
LPGPRLLQLRQRIDHGAQRDALTRADSEFAIRVVDVGPVHEALGEAGHGREQVLHRHRALDRTRHEIRRDACLVDGQVAPLRNESTRRIVQLKATVFVPGSM